MPVDSEIRPTIIVLAGTNGAGKSSVVGAEVRSAGAKYYNPDEAARRILAHSPELGINGANSVAWHEGRRLLERAIRERGNLVFETTLGGSTIRALLERAAESGFNLRIRYIGLASPEQHIARVRARVAKGGHDIPEGKIRERYDQSRINLIRLLPFLTSLRVYDNSEEGDPATEGPRPKLILSVEAKRIVQVLPGDEVPEWAQPIVGAAQRLV